MTASRSSPGRSLLVLAVIAAVVVVPLIYFVVLPRRSAAAGDEFARVMTVGKTYYDSGEAGKAVESFGRAVELQPTNPDALLNLANASLLANQPEAALRVAKQVLEMDASSAAAHYIAGCAEIRLRRFEEAIRHLDPAKAIDRKVNAVSFQLGRAFQDMGRYQEAVAQFEEILQFDPAYPSANYMLAQALIRLGRTDEANQALQRHQEQLAGRPAPAADLAFFERCVYTEARAPFALEQPAAEGIRVTLVDATAEVLGGAAAGYRGPLGVIDINRRGASDLWVREGSGGFRLLMNRGGKLVAEGEAVPARGGAYGRCLVGDINNDRYEDVLWVGDQGVQLLKLGTNGTATDLSQFARVGEVRGVDGALVDLDFTGKLDLVLVGAEDRRLRVLRNLGSTGGNPYFKEITQTSGIPANLTGVLQLAVEDWNHDDVNDLVLARQGQGATVLTKVRGGLLTETNAPAGWPAASALATGDVNNDLRSDVVLAAGETLSVVLAGLTNRVSLGAGGLGVRGVRLVDYDNDGWLDVVAWGKGMRAWRNLGLAGFRETTGALGLGGVSGEVDGVVFADFDQDGDTDVVYSAGEAGLRYLRNDGGHANQQLKLTLIGNRSNASGLGVRVELVAGRWRTMRTVQSLPVEIGVGSAPQLNTLTVRWFDLAPPQVDVKFDSKVPVPIIELQFNSTGSCPYLYAWDGKKFRFVTDLLGAAPLGLPVSESRWVEADPDELVHIGGEAQFPPRGEHHVLQITEELREVLYLDAAALVAVDHPEGTEVYTTGKMVPGRPFPKHEIVTLGRPHRLRQAMRNDGLDVTEALQAVDRRMFSPVARRIPQLRGLAEPYAVTLDFGPLPVERPLVLAMTGWLRFGGGMANIAASQHPDLPFPFPTLEVEVGEGQWRPVDVVVGAPCGKTKSMVVDLTGKLPAGSRRLRWSAAFEIHWDRMALMERVGEEGTVVTRLTPDTADLHWRGFCEMEALPDDQPLTPDYDRVRQNALWRITPSGWCTRYGDVKELVEKRDNALALLNGGDEVTLTFATSRLPAKGAGAVRDFFLYSCGWDKDADFHVELGWLVDPLPWHGMDDQRYGQEPRPAHLDDGWIRKYNTRWVGERTLDRERGLATRRR